MSTVGKWQQQTILSAVNVPKQRQDQLLATKAFASLIKADGLYAVFASYRERGNRDYWLFRSKDVAKQAKGPIKIAGGTTIRTKQWYVEGHWYLSTSDEQGRKSYKLLEDELVSVPVASFVQEQGLEWQREGRSGSEGQSLLSKESHLALVRHNYSNVQ